MADVQQRIIPIKIELDSDESLRSAFNASYLLNLRQNINRNANASIDGNPLNQGSNVGAITPIQSPEAICANIELPAGNNVCIGAFNSPVTGEIYWENFNDLGNHNIWVYGIETQTCRKVYQGDCLGFRFEPEYHLPAHRCALFIVYDSDGNGNRTILNKFYVFTDGTNWQRLIDVESSIATDSYNANLYSYFRTFAPYCDPCEFIQLGIRPPWTCPIVLAFDDTTQLQYYQPEPENNNLKQKVWYFATSFIDRCGRHSVLSPYSTAVFLDGGDCGADEQDIKCFKLQLDAGSWLVEKIVVYFSNDGINWFKYDEVDKWQDCSPAGDNFWDRELALQNYYAPTETCNYDLVITVSGVASFTVTLTINGETVVSPSVTWSTFLDYMDSLGWTIVSAVNSGGAGSPKIITLTFPGSADVYGSQAIYTITGVNTPFEVVQSGCVESDCPDTGCFSTFTYSWDLAFSPALDVTSASIVINGVTYTNTDVAGLHGLIMWLNSLGLGTFTIDTSDQLTASSASNVYGILQISESPVEGEVTPTVTEVQQCSTANTFIYQFCGNKQCIPVSPTEVARIFDDLPIASVGQAVVDDRIAYGDNLRGYDNFICPIENVQITMEQDTQCNTENVTIIVRAVIENFAENRNNPITQLAGVDTIAMGGYGTAGTIDAGIVSAWNQEIVNEFKGLIASLNGFKTVSQQYRLNDPNHVYGVPQDPTSGNLLDAYAGNYYYQEWKFVVPKNTYYKFQVHSHLAPDLSSATDTSTYFYGTIKTTAYTPTGDIRGAMEGTALRELLIPACSGDYTYPDYVVIADLSRSGAAIGGYLKEQDTNLAVELADSQFHTGTTTIQTARTDANGFWFAMSTAGNFQVTVSVTGSDCNVKTATTNQTDGARFVESDKVVPLTGAGLSDYNQCCHSFVVGTIKDCNGNPISGVPVMITRTNRVAVTDLDGNFTILVHDDAFRLFNFAGHRTGDTVIIAPSGSCLYTSGCECVPCLPAYAVNFPFCFTCPVVTQIVGAPFITLGNLIPEDTKGAKTGGTYAISIIGYDYLDRNNEAQLIGYFTVPTIQSNGVFAPYHFNWAFTAPMNFPSWVKKIRFAVRLNDNEFLLQWATNKVEFVDSNGNITAPELAVNIKIYIDSINDFRTQAFFNTNVNYQWVAGDRIRFITNGDGTVFDTGSNNGLIDLPVSKIENGNVLLIPFDARLIDLTALATFELYRQPVCEIEAVYYEQCPSIPVIDGEPTITSGTIPFFDTYWFFRSIPMTNQDGIPITFTSSHPYEHYAPSDYWGTTFTADIPQIRLFSRGRPFVRNENARQTWYLSEDAWSDSLLEDGVINGLGTWRTINRKSYFTQGGGGIVAMKAQDGLLMHICTDNWFIVNIAQNLLLITSAGNVQANPDYFGNKQQKIGNIYGVDYRDTSTVIFRQQWIMWSDVSRAAQCFSNYQTVWDVTKPNEGISEGGMQSYWIEKFREIASLRSLNQFTDGFMFLHAGFSIKSNEVVITSFARGSSPSTIYYGTDADDYNIEANETVSYSISGYWSGNYSFTPERFIEFDSARNGSQLISFVEGKMWMHNVINPTTVSFNNFYGTQYRKIFTPVFNGGEGKNNLQKIFLALRNECKDEKFTCDEATTQTGQLSKIPAEAWDRISNYFEAPILMDENSEIFSGLLPLLEGTNLFGTWCRIRMIGEVGKENNYCEITGIIISAAESY